jgi:hypothetical protein
MVGRQCVCPETIESEVSASSLDDVMFRSGLNARKAVGNTSRLRQLALQLLEVKRSVKNWCDRFLQGQTWYPVLASGAVRHSSRLMEAASTKQICAIFMVMSFVEV